ncbi:hypothetical protein BG011_002849 [Mortierella polycephala]|uniref:Uncharacterized protein n=1 Tax=Mortierella polycephala TaxID=41804 RepID=A0A9P6U3M5_9FUNG|nr:hypothetical protein BG011_002849 [Mortierella polycephala]
MPREWDRARDDDSRSYSMDYNMHGASGRSEEHASVTRDEHYIAAILGDDMDDEAHGSEEEQELLVEGIIDGNMFQQQNNTYQSRLLTGSMPQNIDNSVASILKEAMHDYADPYDYQDSPGMEPTRHQSARQMDQQIALEDDDYDDNPKDWSGSTPNRLVRSVQDHRMTPKTPPIIKRTTLHPRPSSEMVPRQARNVKTVSIEGELKPTIPRPSTSQRAMSGPGYGIPEPPSMKIQGIHARKTQVSKIAVRSAMKAPINHRNSNGVHEPKRKLGLRIQLPADLLDDDDDEKEEVDRENPVRPPSVSTKETGMNGAQSSVERAEQVEQTELEDLADVAPKPVPGPSRFTRISKNFVPPANKHITTIPIPQDDENEVQESIKKLKALLGRLGLTPLSSTLESSMNELDAATIEKGGLCEMTGLLQKLGTTYEGKLDLIQDMTDLIANHEGRFQSLEQELEAVKSDLDASMERNRDLEMRNREMAKELEQLRACKAEKSTSVTTSRKGKLLDAASQVDAATTPLATGWGHADWKGHIKKIEGEIRALKSVLDNKSTTSSGSISIEKVEKLVERLDNALQDNRELQQENRKLTKKLVRLQDDDTVDERENTVSKYKLLLKKVMAKLGVDGHEDILLALDEIERIMSDLPGQKWFIARAERIIWESEIHNKTVSVRRYPLSILNGSEDEDDAKTCRTLTLPTLLSRYSRDGEKTRWPTMSGGEATFKSGRSCTQNFEQTLQRLEEWSELLDVLNHVVFADSEAS